MKTSNKVLSIIIVAVFCFIILGAFMARVQAGSFSLNWLHHEVVGDGNIVSSQYKLPAFREIKVGGVSNVKVTPGEPKIVITTDKNIMPFVKFYVVSGVLHIGSKDGVDLRPSNDINIRIFSNKDIVKVALGGVVRLRMKGINTRYFSLLSGGVSRSRLEGKVQKLNIKVGGTGRINAKKLLANDVNVKIAGAGRAIVYAKRKLNVTIAGTGRVEYYGNPVKINQRIAGVGKIINSGGSDDT